MHLPQRLLALSSALIPSLHPPLKPINITLITFDTLPSPPTPSPPPNFHHHLHFHHASIFDPLSPPLSHLISPHDHNCAASPPNALLLSRQYEAGPPAGFAIANATAMEEAGLRAEFALLGMRIKPLDAPEPGTWVWVKGFKGAAGGRGVVEWGVFFPSGFHAGLDVGMEVVSGEDWGGLERVEVGGDFGEGGLDWEVCVDDLRVQFFALEAGV